VGGEDSVFELYKEKTGSRERHAVEKRGPPGVRKGGAQEKAALENSQQGIPWGGRETHFHDEGG